MFFGTAGRAGLSVGCLELACALVAGCEAEKLRGRRQTDEIVRGLRIGVDTGS